MDRGQGRLPTTVGGLGHRSAGELRIQELGSGSIPSLHSHRACRHQCQGDELSGYHRWLLFSHNGIHVSFSIFVSSGYMPRSYGYMLGHMEVLFLVFKGISIKTSIVAVSIYIPTNSAKVSLFSTPSPTFILCILFDVYKLMYTILMYTILTSVK